MQHIDWYCSSIGINLEVECTSDKDCPVEQACVKSQCIDPCKIRGVCGENAVCRVVFHKPWCSCPQCHVGNPTQICRPDIKCQSVGRPIKPFGTCATNEDCPNNMACNKAIGSCENPCLWTVGSQQICTSTHKCEVLNHKATCICKNRLVINENMELICPNPDAIGCFNDYDCADNLACVSNKCQNPCSGMQCGTSGKVCRVLNHKPACYCDTHQCTSSASICLKDSGCPQHLACVSYQCKDPCASTTCPEGRPCFVQDHKAYCKWCPPRFVEDGNNGCKGNSSPGRIVE
jgi:hypothetical protein